MNVIYLEILFFPAVCEHSKKTFCRKPIQGFWDCHYVEVFISFRDLRNFIWVFDRCLFNQLGLVLNFMIPASDRTCSQTKFRNQS
jgi:hypothetical protein